MSEPSRSSPAWPAAEIRYEHGVKHQEAGDTNAAIDDYRASLDVCPEFYPARFNLAKALRLSGHHREALAEYEAFLALKSPEEEYAKLVGTAESGMIRARMGLDNQLMKERGHDRVSVKLYAHGKCRASSSGPSEYCSQVQQILRGVTNVYASVDREGFERAMRRAGIPDEAITVFLQTQKMFDDTYADEGSDW